MIALAQLSYVASPHLKDEIDNWEAGSRSVAT
jgi:hypothetical protein